MSISIYNYGDYRTFLKDFHVSRKKRRGWSLLVWGKQLGVRSPSTLWMIMKGDRHPSPKLVQSICDYFSFDTAEADHFTNLVRLGKCGNDVKLSVILMEQLAKNVDHGEFTRLSHEKFISISNWYYYAVREVVSLPGFRENTNWLSQRFNFELSPKQIKEAIQTLLALGLLVRDSSGKLQSTSLHVDTRSDFADEGLIRFHEQILENARLSVRKNPIHSREFQGASVNVSLRDMEKAKTMIRKFIYEFAHAIESRNGHAVYQLETAFFPLVDLAQENSNGR